MWTLVMVTVISVSGLGTPITRSVAAVSLGKFATIDACKAASGQPDNPTIVPGFGDSSVVYLCAPAGN